MSKAFRKYLDYPACEAKDCTQKIDDKFKYCINHCQHKTVQLKCCGGRGGSVGLQTRYYRVKCVLCGYWNDNSDTIEVVKDSQLEQVLSKISTTGSRKITVPGVAQNWGADDE